MTMLAENPTRPMYRGPVRVPKELLMRASLLSCTIAEWRNQGQGSIATFPTYKNFTAGTVGGSGVWSRGEVGPYIKMVQGTSDFYNTGLTPGIIAAGTVCLYCRPHARSPGAAYSLISNRTAAPPHSFRFDVDNTNTRYNLTKTGSVAISLNTGTGSLAYDEWEFFVIDFGSQGMRIYRNGGLIASNSTKTGLAAAADPILIGKDSSLGASVMDLALFAMWSEQIGPKVNGLMTGRRSAA